MRTWVAAVHPAWQEVDMTAADVMQQAAACMGAAVDAVLEGASTQGFTAKVLPSGAQEFKMANSILLAS